jgi:Calcineurin-like phosphoesterase
MILSYYHKKQPDFIGDIHGAFGALEMLFRKLGYEKKNGIYKHPERIPIFVGDYIDRGNQIKETLHAVRSMQESGNAIALMGNHEYNFLAFHFSDENGKKFRPNSTNNRKQLSKTKQALKNKDELKSYLQWMARLPLVLEGHSFRAVHAQWNSEYIKAVQSCGIKKLDEDGFRRLHNNQLLVQRVEVMLKGAEVEIPRDLHYEDYEGHKRESCRVKWWKKPTGTVMSQHFASLPNHLHGLSLGNFNPKFNSYYNSSEKPVFFGHYWLPPGEFGLTAANACCLDFSIANYGLLAAYRFSGEKKLSAKNLFRHY